jgi:hypothetical protein
MKTNTVSNFYADYCTVVQNFVTNIYKFRKFDKSYEAVQLADIITDGVDFGVSAGSHALLLPWFSDFKAIATGVLNALAEHRDLLSYYTSLGLSTSISDNEAFSDGILGSELKSALSSMSALETYLTAGFHYTNLCPIEYTASKNSADWIAGITGAQLKSVIFSLLQADTFLINGFHYSNLDKLI